MEEINNIDNRKDILVKSIYFLVAITLSAFGVGGDFFVTREILYALDSENWPQSTGLITSSRIKESRSSSASTGSQNNYTYSPEVKYSFAIDGKNYEGGNIEFIGFGSGDPSYAYDTVGIFPVGKAVGVYYLPQNPEVNTLNPGVDRGAWIAYFVLLAFSAIGPIMLFKANQFIKELLGESA